MNKIGIKDHSDTSKLIINNSQIAKKNKQKFHATNELIQIENENMPS